MAFLREASLAPRHSGIRAVEGHDAGFASGLMSNWCGVLRTSGVAVGGVDHTQHTLSAPSHAAYGREVNDPLPHREQTVGRPVRSAGLLDPWLSHTDKRRTRAISTKLLRIAYSSRAVVSDLGWWSRSHAPNQKYRSSGHKFIVVLKLGRAQSRALMRSIRSRFSDIGAFSIAGGNRQDICGGSGGGRGGRACYVIFGHRIGAHLDENGHVIRPS